MAAFIFTGPLLRVIVGRWCRLSGRPRRIYCQACRRDDAGPGGGDVANESVQIWRVYTVEDGTSCMEQVEIPLESARFGAASKLLAGPGALVRRMDAGVKLP